MLKRCNPVVARDTADLTYAFSVMQGYKSHTFYVSQAFLYKKSVTTCCFYAKFADYAEYQD